MFKPVRSKRSAGALSAGCLTLFGLPFLGAGLFLAGIYFYGYAKWWDARNWVETPCWIESAELKVNDDGDSTSYKAVATYRYEFEGRQYRSDKVSFGGGSDNVGDFQKDAHRELSRHAGRRPAGAERDPRVDRDDPFRCFVNPSHPSEAVLYRDLRWEMQAFMAIFALTFPAVGAGLVFGGLLGAKAGRRENDLRERHPDEPWKWKPGWVEPAIPESTSLWRKGVYLYTIWAGLVILPLLYATWKCGAFSRGGTVWLVFVFPLLWSVPLWFSLRRLRHRMAVGATRFEMKESPAWPGGVLAGAILLDKPPPMRLPAELRLACRKLTTRKSSDGDSTSTETVWSHREGVGLDLATRDLTGFRLPVAVPIPADAPQSGDGGDPQVKHVWKLELKVPGTPIDSAFEVPVFRTEKSPPLESAGENAASISDDVMAELPGLLAERRIRADFDAAGMPVSIVCPPARHVGLIVFLFVFDLIWTAASVFLIVQEAPWIFRIVWPVSSAVIWIILIRLLLHRRTATFGAGGVEVREQLGPWGRTRIFEKKQIVGFSHDTNMSSNGVSFYQVRLEDTLGRRQTLVDGIAGAAPAAALVKRLQTWWKS